ncbi:MAG TPA: phosphopantetheine-binding protein, partial [Gemmatimonadales bacterium]|nr:phosphopantetheine-binding protein [Gemmatimonadales bacterium]
MGLDAVEFVMAVEAAFAIDIPDTDATQLATPGQLVDYLERRLAPSSASFEFNSASACLEQRAFYLIRRASLKLFDVGRAEIQPDTPWDHILPTGDERAAWRALGEAVAAETWPSRKLWLMPETSTVGGTAKHLAVLTPRSFRPETEPWTRVTIERVVTGLVWEELGIKKFAWTDRFVH